MTNQIYEVLQQGKKYSLMACKNLRAAKDCYEYRGKQLARCSDERENKVNTIFEVLDEELREVVESDSQVKLTDIVEELEDMDGYFSDTSNQEWLVETVLQDLIESVYFEKLFISLCDGYNGQEEGFKKVPSEIMEFYIEDKDLVEKFKKIAEDKIDFQYRTPNRY